GDAAPVFRAADVLQIFNPARCARGFAGQKSRPAETGPAFAEISDAPTDFVFARRPGKITGTAKTKERPRPADFRGRLSARRGGAGNDLFLRPARERTVRP